MPWQTVVAVQLQAGNTIINPNGDFVYSSAPAAWNLVSSNTPAAGVDQFNNHYLAGITSYGSGFAIQINAGNVTFYGGSLAAGWSSTASISADAFGDITILQPAGRSVLTTFNTLDDGAGNMTVGNNLAVTTGLTVGGSSNTGDPITDATIATTSGNFNGGTLTSHNHSFGHTHPF